MTSALEWFDYHWMFLGPPLCIMVAIWKLGLLKSAKQATVDSKDQELHMYSWLALMVYASHQFEEHGYDLYGRRYHFIEFYNDTAPWGTQLSPRIITIINTGSVLTMFGIFAQWSETTRDYSKTGFMYGLMAFNGGVLHLLPCLVAHGAYNPGTVQSIIMTPLALYVLYKVYLRYGTGTLLASFLYGSVYAHVLVLLLPLKLVSLGYLNDAGFAIWAMGLLMMYPIMISPLLKMGKTRKD